MRKTKKPSATQGVELDNIPRATITLTDESVYLTRHDRTGAPAATYPVSAAGVANAFNLFGASTGLLPAETLFWQNRGGQLRIGVYLPAGKRTITVRSHTVQHWTIPLPGFVFVGCGTQYQIYAVADRPRRESDQVYHCPLPNVYPDGKICAGDVPFPKCAADTIAQAAALFFESEFNHDLSGQETMQLLKNLCSKRTFPAKVLRPAATMANVLEDRRAGDLFDDDEQEAHGIDGIDPYEYAYGETENDDED